MTLENVQEVLHLTPSQAGMLFHSATGRSSGVYVALIRCELIGALDVDAFKRAWDETVQRHPALRAAFVWDGVDEPLQVIHEQVALPWTELDWSDVPAEERGRRLQSLLDDERRRGFALDTAPLMRMLLVREAARAHRFVWTCHHIVADGWSASVVLEEVLARYGAIRTGSALELPPATGFREYAAWLGRRSPDQDEAFWRSYLGGFAARTDVPPDRVSGPTAEPALHRFVHHRWSPRGSEALRQLARDTGLTLNTLLQGAWFVLLHRYTGALDLVSGTAVAGRPAEVPAVEDAVGLFINTLPVRVRVDVDRRLGDWLTELQTSFLDVRAHQHAALVDIQGWSEMPAGEGLFDNLMVVENVPGSGAEEVDGVRVQGLAIDDASNYPLAMLIRPGERMEQTLVYDPSVYSDALATRVVEHFRNVVTGLSGGLDQSVGSLPVMSDEELHRVVVDWNDSGDVALGVETVLDLVSEHARATPRATAVAFGDEELSYGELARRSDAWACSLVSRGVAPGDRVGLLMERGHGQITGVLAIMKAGAAYVPLDPDYPPERLAAMTEDSGAKIVLATSGTAGMVAPASVAVVVDGEDGHGPSSLPQVSGDSLAYVIYTSGSTGTPKGVPVGHRNLLHSTRARSVYYRHRPDSFLLLSSVAFDSSVAGIFWTLTTGGTLVLPEPRSEQDVIRLSAIIAESGASHTLCLPSLYGALLAHGDPSRLGSLRTVIVAGEALPSELVRTHRSTLPATELFNEYGPTEATVWCTVYDTAEYGGEGPVPIGRPMPGARIHILDDHGRPVPPGVIGEIHVAGEGLASGYLGRPEATTRHFVRRIIGGESVRLYRTGDLGRYLPDGNIEFRGRKDRQIKVRGFRVEPGEIESVLLAHEAIGEAVVQATGADPAASGRRTLTAFVTAPPGAEGHSPTPEELRDHLRGLLPEHMVPGRIRVVEAIPRLPNGKVDTAALGALTHRDVGSVPDQVAPRTATERQLAEIWQDVLQVDEIGVNDTFFELGGDSILSIHVTSRANQLGLGLSPNDIFNFPTVAELATRCQNGSSGLAAGSEGHQDAVDGTSGPADRPPLFLVHVGIKLAARLRERLGPGQPIFCFSAHWHRADLDMDATVEGLAQECLAELRSVQPVGPYLVGGYSMGATIALEMAQQLRAQGETVKMLFLLDPPPTREGFAVDGSAPVNRIHFADALSEGPPKTLLDKVSNHRAALSGRTSRGKATYLWRESLAQIRYRILEPLRLSTAVAMRRAGLGVPLPLRDPYVLMVYVRAWSRYEVAPYAGDVVIFSGRGPEAEDTVASWKRRIEGDVLVETFQGSHLDFVMKDELVDRWARRLSDVLAGFRIG